MSTKTKLYNWDTIEEEVVRPGVSRKGFRGDHFMMVMNTLFYRLLFQHLHFGQKAIAFKSGVIGPLKGLLPINWVMLILVQSLVSYHQNKYESLQVKVGNHEVTQKSIN